MAQFDSSQLTFRPDQLNFDFPASEPSATSLDQLGLDTTFDAFDGLQPSNIDLSFNNIEQSNLSFPTNRFMEPGSDTLPSHAPYMPTSYDSSIHNAYTSNDTDADKVRKWENLITLANLAGAGVPLARPQPIEQDVTAQNPQIVDSPNSLFDSSRSSSVEIIEPPSSTAVNASMPKASAATSITNVPIAPIPPKTPVTGVTSSIPVMKLPAKQLPQSLVTNGGAKHVSPFAPIGAQKITAPAAPPSSLALQRAHQRIQSLAKERNYYQRSLRKATCIDPKTGKTSSQMLQEENTSLRRVNANQLTKLEELKEEVELTKSQYVFLAELYNKNILQLHKAQFELQQLKGM